MKEFQISNSMVGNTGVTKHTTSTAYEFDVKYTFKQQIGLSTQTLTRVYLVWCLGAKTNSRSKYLGVINCYGEVKLII